MSDSSDEDFDEDWVPYSRRPEFEDVVPLAQDDGNFPVVCINYSPRFREVYDYMRGIMAKNEKSVRALKLTQDALKLNPANYTVWQYRRDILNHLNADLYDELQYVDEVIRENAKNYQVWYHRRVLVEMLNDPSKELDLTSDVLELDAKNYHAWQHRQWAIKTYNLYDMELSFVDRLIAEDIRNNSAWNQRYFVLKHFGFTPEVIQHEIQYTINRIKVVKNNESAWNYLVGILKRDKPVIDASVLQQYPDVLHFADELYLNGIRSTYLLAFLVDINILLCLNAATPEIEEQLSRRIFGLCDDLSKKHDVVRRTYWRYVADRFKKKLKSRANA